SAVMNRSERELERIAGLLKTGDDLPVPELLFLDSEASLHANRFVLTVVHAFQALELFIDDFLRTRLAATGLDALTVDKKLDQHWRTKERLKELLKEATGHALTENPALWDPFCNVYDQVRNRLIHAAKEVDKAKAELCLSTCQNVVEWLLT